MNSGLRRAVGSAAAIVLAAALGACSTVAPLAMLPDKESKTAARSSGGLVAVGASVDLDARAVSLADAAIRAALESPPGAGPVPWTTDDGAASGTVVPGIVFVSGARRCRDYLQHVYAAGTAREVRSVACIGAHGWTPA